MHHWWCSSDGAGGGFCVKIWGKYVCFFCIAGVGLDWFLILGVGLVFYSIMLKSDG